MGIIPMIYKKIDDSSVKKSKKKLREIISLAKIKLKNMKTTSHNTKNQKTCNEIQRDKKYENFSVRISREQLKKSKSMKRKTFIKTLFFNRQDSGSFKIKISCKANERVFKDVTLPSGEI